MVDPVKTLKGFKYIRFKEFRAPEGADNPWGGSEGPRGASIFLLRGSAAILTIYIENVRITIGNSAIMLGIIERS